MLFDICRFACCVRSDKVIIRDYSRCRNMSDSTDIYPCVVKGGKNTAEILLNIANFRQVLAGL